MTRAKNVVQISAAGENVMVMKADGSRDWWGPDLNTLPTLDRPDWVDWSQTMQVAHTQSHVFALGVDETVSWLGPPHLVGRPGAHTLGIPMVPVPIPGLRDVIQIVCTQSAGYALLSDYTVMRWKGLGETAEDAPVRIDGLTHIRRLATAGTTSDRMYFIRHPRSAWSALHAS